MTFPVLSANGPSGYNLTNSLRFRSSASAYLNKTIGAGGTNTKHVTSFWMKRGAISTAAYTVIYGAQIDANNFIYIWIPSTDKISIYWVSGGVVVLDMRSTLVLRDPSSWYHIYFAQDTTQATAANRFKIWLNGVEITSWSTNINSTTQNFGTPFGGNNVHNIGRDPTTSSNYFDGYIAEFNDIWQPSTIPPVTDFGSTNPVTGVWQPAKYTGTYGTNGFYLPFTDTTSTSTLGNDFSGNGNNWTTNNISLTPGATYDAMTDVPTLTSPTAANYCVLNPIQISGGTLSAANLNLSFSATTSPFNTRGTVGVSSGKWYYEATMTSSGLGSISIGIKKTSSNTDTAITDGNGWFYYGYSGSTNGIKVNTTGAAYGASFTSGDVIGVAYDVSAGEITFYKNNVSQGVAFTAQSFGEVVPAFYYDGSNTAQSLVVNFGQRPFAYTPPSGFVALNTFNLPSSTIPAGNKYMDATLYTGTGSSLSVTNSGAMQPDWVWIKSRSAATDHALYDVLRGTQARLESNTTDAQVTSDNGVTAFGTGGFTVGTLAQVNTSAATYVGWQWKAGGTGVTNTAGSITSTVSANTTSGFSVVTYTANGTNGATVGHGLNVTPAIYIVKRRDTTGNWVVVPGNSSLFGGSFYLQLNTFSAVIANSDVFTSYPGSSVFYLSTNADVNASGGTYVAYCIAQIAGFSAVGKYTGNGSTDGPFVYTGFRPRFVMIKAINDIFNWRILDTSRDISNVEEKELYPSLSNAEATQVTLDGLSNGFKIRTTGAGINTSAGAYLYVAFAENPFKNALAR